MEEKNRICRLNRGIYERRGGREERAKGGLTRRGPLLHREVIHESERRYLVGLEAVARSISLAKTIRVVSPPA